MSGTHDLDAFDAELQSVLESITFAADRFDSPATSLRLLDRMNEQFHLGVHVKYLTSEVDEDLSDGRLTEWVEDEVDVVLAYQLRNDGQRESRRLAFEVERMIRLAITGAPALQPHQPRYKRSQRSDDTPEIGWYRIVQRYQFHRNAEVR